MVFGYKRIISDVSHAFLLFVAPWFVMYAERVVSFSCWAWWGWRGAHLQDSHPAYVQRARARALARAVLFLMHRLAPARACACIRALRSAAP